jgi:sugar lactone lactonase YvrE
MEAGRVHATDLRGELELVAEVERTPCGLGWSTEGDLLVVSRHDRRLLRFAWERASASDPAFESVSLSELAGSDLNDLVVDEQGRAYIGAFGYDYLAGAAAQPAPIVLVYPDGAARVAATGLEFPNGMVVDSARRLLYVAETWVGRVSALSIADDGTLGDRRLFAELAPRMPDGICFDAEGALWVGCPISHELVRVLDGGAITDVVKTPGRHCMSCALGGSDGRTLIIGTADTDFDPLDPLRGASRPSAGRIELVRVDVPGVEAP